MTDTAVTDTAGLAAVAAKLEIIEACTRVHWSYDHEDWDALDELFDATVSMPTPAQAAEPGFDPEAYLSSFLLPRAGVKQALRSAKAGLVTQHLITGHQVALHDARAVCRAHALNVHFRGTPGDGDMYLHGNEYRFDLARTADGWRIRGWISQIRWRRGDEGSSSALASQLAWLGVAGQAAGE